MTTRIKTNIKPAPRFINGEVARHGGWTLHTTIGDVVTAPAVIGEEVTTSRGETYVLEGGEPPRHEGSTGRVWLALESGAVVEYYPSVIGCKWVEDTDA